MALGDCLFVTEGYRRLSEGESIAELSHQDVWQQLEKARKELPDLGWLVVRKVKAHTRPGDVARGIITAADRDLNEAVDALARQGAEVHLPDPEMVRRAKRRERATILLHSMYTRVLLARAGEYDKVRKTAEYDKKKGERVDPTTLPERPELPLPLGWRAEGVLEEGSKKPDQDDKDWACIVREATKEKTEEEVLEDYEHELTQEQDEELREWEEQERLRQEMQEELTNMMQDEEDEEMVRSTMTDEELREQGWRVGEGEVEQEQEDRILAEAVEAAEQMCKRLFGPDREDESGGSEDQFGDWEPERRRDTERATEEVPDLLSAEEAAYGQEGNLIFVWKERSQERFPWDYRATGGGRRIRRSLSLTPKRTLRSGRRGSGKRRRRSCSVCSPSSSSSFCLSSSSPAGPRGQARWVGIPIAPPSPTRGPKKHIISWG